MTRQKKEIINRIEYLMDMSDADNELGSGFGQRDPNEEEIDRLLCELAKLRHYPSMRDMIYDDRNYR